jgi:predicted TIM-barrel fold metal-dependent hydrolase
MIIDSHSHIYSKKIRKNKEKYFVDPIFKRFYNSDKARLAGAKDVIDTMDRYHVDVSVVFGFPWNNLSILQEQNDYIIETVNKYPGRFIGFCCLDPFIKNAEMEVERCIAAGLKGVGELFFHKRGIDNESIQALSPIMEICLEKDLPVLIHTNEPIGHIYPGKTPNTLSQIYNMVRKFPKNKIILAHMGGGIFFFNLLKKEVKESLKNVYFDTAVSTLLYDNSMLPMAIDIIGADKIIFGSDFPIEVPWDYFEVFRKTGMTQDVMDKICGMNIKRILNL